MVKLKRMAEQSCHLNAKIRYWLRHIWGSPSFRECMVCVCAYLIILTIHVSRLCEITSFTGSTDSLRTVFSDACAKMTKEEAQWVVFLFYIWRTFPMLRYMQVVFAGSPVYQERMLCQYGSYQPRWSLRWQLPTPHARKEVTSNWYHDGYRHRKLLDRFSTSRTSPLPLFHTQNKYCPSRAGLPTGYISLGHVIQIQCCCRHVESIWLFLHHTRWR